MNQSPPFDSPLLLGFEHTRALVERAARTAAEGYPPYNVEDLGEGAVRIVLAVAGFGAGQIDITVEANQLTVTGRRETEEEERAFLHRGIAARGFARVSSSPTAWRSAEPGSITACCTSRRPALRRATAFVASPLRRFRNRSVPVHVEFR